MVYQYHVAKSEAKEKHGRDPLNPATWADIERRVMGIRSYDRYQIFRKEFTRIADIEPTWSKHRVGERALQNVKNALPPLVGKNSRSDEGLPSLSKDDLKGLPNGDFLEATKFAITNIGTVDIEPSDAPSKLAFMVYCMVRDDKDFRGDFLSRWCVRAMPSQSKIDEAETTGLTTDNALSHLDRLAAYSEQLKGEEEYAESEEEVEAVA